MKARSCACILAAALVICTTPDLLSQSRESEIPTESGPAEDSYDAAPPPTVVEFTVEADTFADGGQGCWQGPFYCGGAYYDETPGNWGDAQVRPGTDVDLWYDDGGIVIGGLDGLEWLTFPVTVLQGGRYRVTFRTASPADRPLGSGVVNVGIYGVDDSWLGNQTVPITGGAGDWHTYATWPAPTTIYLPAGAQTLTLWAAGGYYNVRSMRFTLEEPAVPLPDPIVPNQLNPMVLSGTVRDERGTAVPGAQIVLTYYGALVNEQLVLVTDAIGRYEAAFDAIPNGYFGALALMSASKDFWTTYEGNNRFVYVNTQHATYDILLRDIEWITAASSGMLPASVEVTVKPDDPLCYNDAQDPTFGSNSVCHPLRLIAASSGTIRIEMVPTGPVAPGIGLEIGVYRPLFGGGSAHCCDAAGVRLVPVTAGDVVILNPQVSPGHTQAFTIHLSM